MDKISQRQIRELVNENYTFASILFFFGIHFYNHSEQTLEEVCKEKGLSLDKVIRNFEKVTRETSCNQPELAQCPVDLVIEYLKHSHFLFIKYKLPYISNLISALNADHTDKVGKDLKFIFPFFVEDFIKHIYEEEDTLFRYILSLQAVFQNKQPVSKVYFQMEKHSIQDYALEHTLDDDEMAGIRKLTNNYSCEDALDLHLKVIFQELQAFEKELINHAAIENQILFPKALSLEQEVNQKLKSLISRN